MKLREIALTPSIVAIIVSLASMLSSVDAVAADWYWVSGSADFSDANSYLNESGQRGTGVPAADDIVHVTNSCEIVVRSTDEWFVRTLEILNKPIRIDPAVAGVTITFDIVGENEDYTILSPIVSAAELYSTYPEYGKIVKTGKGKLELGAIDKIKRSGSSGRYDYFICLNVQEGVLRMPQNASSNGAFIHGSINVEKDATFITGKRGDGAWSSGLKTMVYGWFMGGGTVIHNSNGSSLQLYKDDDADHRFSGKLSGCSWLYIQKNISFTGTESDIASGEAWTLYNGSATKLSSGPGTLWVQSVGAATAPSSMGASSTIVSTGGGLGYLGTGEKAGKTIDVRAYPTFIDGGVNGGLDWGGGISIIERYASMYNFYLLGDHTNACTISGSVSSLTAGGQVVSPYFTKRGKGTWRFVHNAARNNAGALYVEDGTIEFDTFYEKGTVCSLGTAKTLTRQMNSGIPTADDLVGYAHLLGSATAEGRMRYIGTNSVHVANRPFAICNKGRLTADGGEFAVAGFSATTDGAVLTLDGTNAAVNVALDVADGDGTLSVVKEGANTWALAGNQTFSGNLTVRDGKLIVRNWIGRPFSWHRLWMKSNAGAVHKEQLQALGLGLGSNNYIGCYDFMLYDASGTHIETVSSHNAHSSALRAGEASYVEGNGVEEPDPTKAIQKPYSLFDNSGSTRLQRTLKVMDMDDSSKWIGAMWRISENCRTAVTYNVRHQYGYAGSEKTYAWRNLAAFKLEGSVDGIHWEDMVTNDSVPLASGNSGTAWTNNKDSRPPLDNTVSTNVFSILSSVGTVSVASGAELEADGEVAPIKALSVSASGGGTIRGFTFAETGTLDVTDFVKGGNERIPMSFVDAKGLARLSKWTLRVNGSTKGFEGAVVDENGITLLRSGLMILIR